MKPAILLTGKSGQIGSELHQLLPRVGRVIAPDRNELNLLDAASIARAVREHRPSVIVNAAAYTAVDAAETDEQRAHAVNAEAVGVLAHAAKEVGALLVHYSTDYVFDGEKRTPYNEADACNPLNAYGRSKLAGEVAIRESGAAHLILRTSWVYATRGKNFLLTILRLATEREELKIVQDQIGAPTLADDIAAGTVEILQQLLGHAGDENWLRSHAGTFHMIAAGVTNWCEFAAAILEEARAVWPGPAWMKAATQNRPLRAKRVLPISAAEFGSPTQRPGYSVLSVERLASAFGVRLPHWRDALHRCFAAPRSADPRSAEASS